MRTNSLRTAAGRATALLGALLAAAALAIPSAFADEAAPAGGERILETRLDLGYRTVDVEDDPARLAPYDPLEDGVVFGLDFLYLTPGFGALKVEGGYLSPESWQAGVEYNHGADLDIRAATRAYTHAREHAPAIPEVHVPIPPPLSAMEAEGADDDPEVTYRDELQETTVSLKVRAPGYPAHLRASGREYTNRGDQQLRYFFRSCSTHMCHVNSRTRELDQVTREYAVGFDTHAGPVDLAYSHAAQTFRDDAADPVDRIGDIMGGLPAGDYAHDVNPDLRSYSDTLTLSTNPTNRMVFSGSYVGGEQENETSGIARRTRTAGANLSWRPTASALVIARYTYDEERTAELGDEARALRVATNAAHAASGTSHQHALEPERTRHTGELSARFSPVEKADLTARVRYRTLERYAGLWKDAGGYVDETQTTNSTLAGLDGRYRAGAGITLDAALGWEWTSGAVYAVENTEAARYGLGATWSPAETLFLRAAWQGFRGENDDAEALQRAWARQPDPPVDSRRQVTGDAFSATASFVPSPEFDLTVSWNLIDNGVEQDLLFGSPANAGYSYLSPDTAWDGRSQLANVRARWKASRRLTLTVEGLWIDSLESYAPTVPQGDTLEELGTVEFTKLLGSVKAEVRVSDAASLALTGFWAKYDDANNDDRDGSSEGLLAAVDLRW